LLTRSYIIKLEEGQRGDTEKKSPGKLERRIFQEGKQPRLERMLSNSRRRGRAQGRIYVKKIIHQGKDTKWLRGRFASTKETPLYAINGMRTIGKKGRKRKVASWGEKPLKRGDRSFYDGRCRLHFR